MTVGTPLNHRSKRHLVHTDVQIQHGAQSDTPTPTWMHKTCHTGTQAHPRGALGFTGWSPHKPHPQPETTLSHPDAELVTQIVTPSRNTLSADSTTRPTSEGCTQLMACAGTQSMEMLPCITETHAESRHAPSPPTSGHGHRLKAHGHRRTQRLHNVDL